MNQVPSDPSPSSGYQSTQGSQTNPFTADLKGEFSSNFGTNTNAVSQIFKEGDYAGKKTRTLVIAGIALLVVLAAAYFLLFDSGGGDFATSDGESAGEIFGGDEAGEDGLALEDGEDEDLGGLGGDGEDGLDDILGEEEGGEVGDLSDILDEGDTPLDAATTGEDIGATGEETAGAGYTGTSEGYSGSAGYSGSYSSSSAGSGGYGPPTLENPPNGARRSYDETSEAATFSWGGGSGGYIYLARNPSMSGATRVRVSGNSFRYQTLHPGTWYWKVENSSGASEVNSFVIEAPIRRGVVVAQPQEGSALAGTGGVVTWQGDTNVAFYRVELNAGGSWANPQHRFATSGTQLQIQGVQPGQYQLRVGSFSEVSGRWEYTGPINVSVQ